MGPVDVWSQARTAIRRTCITTTPKPTGHVEVSGQAMNECACDEAAVPSTICDNLATKFVADEIIAKYEGTRLGRQELNAEILDDVAGALWNRAQIENLRITPRELPDMARIVVALDPPATAGDKADECGLVAAGLGSDGKAYVLKDHSIQGLSPLGWAQRAVNLYHDIRADRLIAEVNQGGAMVTSLIAQVDAAALVKEVRAARSKYARAEPVAALYEQGRVHHAGTFPELEDQLCSFTGARLFGARSPDRLDALVWALTELMLHRHNDFRMRTL